MWIKICGVTAAEDARAVVAAGADAVGLNFFAKSKRFVGRPAGEFSVDSFQCSVKSQPTDAPEPQPGDSGQCESLPQSADDPLSAADPLKGRVADRGDVMSYAKSLREAVAGRLEVVGVFVNASAEEVVGIVDEVGLDTVQFHGDESPELIAEFHSRCPDAAIIRAFRVSDDTVAMDDHLHRLGSLNVPLRAVLIDAAVEGQYGGTGHTVNADVVNRWKQAAGQPYQLVLAGGLKPDNVATAVHATQPWGVDTASGVESAPGVKSAEAVTDLVRAVRSAEPRMDTNKRE